MKIRSITERLKKLVIKLPKNITAFSIVIQYENSIGKTSQFTATNMDKGELISALKSRRI